MHLKKLRLVISTDTAHTMLKRLNCELFPRALLYQPKELCKLRDQLEQKKKALQETIANRKKCPAYQESEAATVSRTASSTSLRLATTSDRTKLEDDVPEEDDEGLRRRKRPKKVPSKENLDQTGIYQAHPLKVILHVNDDEALDQNAVKLLTLRFESLTKLFVLELKGHKNLQSTNILCKSISSMTRALSFLSLQNSALLMALYLMIRELHAHISGPSIWQSLIFSNRGITHQQVCHLRHYYLLRHDAVVSGLSSSESKSNMVTVVQRIRSRKKALPVSYEQLDSVMKAEMPWGDIGSVPLPHSPKSAV
ncbi:hypothetical protein Leryth_026335 [Lithospermum erythrorhizon]|nr:hypothetical protein Leryth_026335 [Lithospermum erythrorhizon]